MHIRELDEQALHEPRGKTQIRNPNLETISKDPNPNDANKWAGGPLEPSAFGIFEFVSDFEFRDSCFFSPRFKVPMHIRQLDEQALHEPGAYR